VPKPRLGKGLQALISDMEVPANEGIVTIALELIFPNPHQPRRVFAEQELQELAESIRQHGVIQPITVRARAEAFELVVGERRLRAAKLAGLTEIPAMVKELSDLESAEIAIIENLQREDLNPLEEAAAFNRLLSELSYTQEQIAARLGKSRPYVANTIRLLALSAPVAELVTKGVLSAGHARAVLSVPDWQREVFAHRIVAQEMTVREAEKEAQRLQNVSRETLPVKEAVRLPLEYREAEARLRDALQTKVTLKLKGAGGTIEIAYHGQEELERLLELLTQQLRA